MFQAEEIISINNTTFENIGKKIGNLKHYSSLGLL